MVVSELRGEKIDIIPFNEEPARFVAKALSPARVREVLVDDESKQATVVVPDDQLSLAIGKEGQNARLAARLTGWRVDIRSETEFAQEEADLAYEDDEASGRCAAIMSTGKRCPNAALPGSRYCGLPAHQALEGKDTDQVEATESDAPAEAEVATAEAAPEPAAEAEPAAAAPAEAEPEAPAEPEAEAAAPETDAAEPEAAPEPEPPAPAAEAEAPADGSAPERGAEEVIEPVASGEPAAAASEGRPAEEQA
jgi:N utilization substance protein A